MCICKLEYLYISYLHVNVDEYRNNEIKIDEKSNRIIHSKLHLGSVEQLTDTKPLVYIRNEHRRRKLNIDHATEIKVGFRVENVLLELSSYGRRIEYQEKALRNY